MDASADTLKKMGKKALIVTDAMMVELGNCAKVERVLEHAKVGYSVFDRIGGEPTDVMVKDEMCIRDRPHHDCCGSDRPDTVFANPE